MTQLKPHVPPHVIDGFLPSIDIFGQQIPSYYPVISFAFCICLLWLLRRAQHLKFDERLVIDSALLVMLTSFIGARLFHVLFEDLSYYRAHPMDILKFWNGGFVFYGGALLTFMCGILFLKFKQQRIGEWLNLYAPVAALGYALGRVACLITGCCFGGVCEFPGFSFRHPTQLYAIVLELAILVVLLKIERMEAANPLFRKIKNVPGYLFCIWIFLHSWARVLMEYFRADPRGPMALGLSLSSCFSLIIILLDIAYLHSIWRARWAA